MQFFLLLLALGLVLYGLFAASLPAVLAGALVVGLSFHPRVGPMTEEEGRRINRWLATVLGAPWRQLLLVALLWAGLAGWLAWRDPFARTSGYLWLAALLLLLVAGIWHDWRLARSWDRPSEPSIDSAVAASEPSPALAVTRSAAGRWTRWDWGAASALLLLALALRVYQLDASLPPVHGDEGEMGMLALLARYGPASGVSEHRLPLFSTGFLNHPSLFHYVQAAGMQLFGESITGLRLLSVLFGALCAPFLYALGRLGWGRSVGLTAGWLLAVSHLHIHYSRIALNNIQSVFLVIVLHWLLAYLYSVRAPRAPGPGADTNPDTDADANAAPRPLLPALGIGLVIGLGQYFYYGSRLLPVLAAPLLFVLWRQRRVSLGQLGALLVAVGVAYFPLALFYLHDPAAFANRSQSVNIFTLHNLTHTLGPDASWPGDIPALLWHQIRINLSFFLHYGDSSAFYVPHLAAFDKMTALLFWLGLGVVLARVRRYHELAVSLWFGVGVFLAGVVTIDAPNGPRLIVVVPSIYLIGGVFVQVIYRRLGQIWPLRQPWIGAAALSAIAVSTLFLNFTTYFGDYKETRRNLAPVHIALEMAAAGRTHHAYLLGEPGLYVRNGILRFVARDAEKFDLEQVELLPELLAQQPAGQGALIIALPNHVDDLDQIEALFPRGSKTARQDDRGQLWYVTYWIPGDEIAKLPTR